MWPRTCYRLSCCVGHSFRTRFRVRMWLHEQIHHGRVPQWQRRAIARWLKP